MILKVRLSKILICLFLVSGLILSACSNQNSTSTSQTIRDQGVTIEFKNGQYMPNKITIKQNQTITFVNHGQDDIWPASNIHPTHGIYPQFDPKKPIKAGDSWSFTFTKIGTWRFHDHLSPEITSTITVTE